MTIAMWSLVLNIVIAVLVVGYGIWLRNIMSQQLQSKNAEIQALEAAIKTRDAQISALQADTAPAIIEKYKNVRTFANEMAAESQQTFDKLNSLTKAFDNLRETHDAHVLQSLKGSVKEQKGREKTALLLRLMGYCEGISFCLRTMSGRLERELPTGNFELSADALSQPMANAFRHTMHRLQSEFRSKSLKADNVLNDLSNE